MELKLFRKTMIADVKEEFSQYFHFLKIEFFFSNHEEAKGSFIQEKIPDEFSLSRTPAFSREGVFYFDASTTVAEFEQRLQTEFGLPVQVFRKSGELWIETILTDNFTLARQNSMGEFSQNTIRFNFHSLFL